MQKYELDQQRYEDDDEIDLAELLKTIIKEKNLVIITTAIFTILAVAFYFYKENKPRNYGVSITFSDETADRLNQFNSVYKNSVIPMNNIVKKSYDSLLSEKSDNDIEVFSSLDAVKIEEALKRDYNFIKIIDVKNKSYQLFSKIKGKDVESIADKINSTVKNDERFLNSEFEKNLNLAVDFYEKSFEDLKSQVENLNKNISHIVEENFGSASKEDLNSNLMIISPVLYVEYKEKINSLNDFYLKLTDLKNIKKNSENLFVFSGEENISVVTLNETSKDDGLSGKIIILAGIILGIGCGMFIAVVKSPLKNVIKEIKEEK